jgi:uncharacterized membrane protein YbhN (UPF0104 family)
MNKKVFKNLAIAFKIVISLLFIYFVNRSVSFKEFDWNSLFSVKTVTVALLGSLISIAFQIERWFVLLKQFGGDCSRRDAALSFFEGSMLAFVTPARAGELLRGYTIKSIDKKKSVIAVLIERFTSVAISFTIGFSLISTLPKLAEGFNWLELFKKGITIAGVLSILFLVFLPKIVTYFSKRDGLKVAIKLILFSIFQFLTVMIQTALLFAIFVSATFKSSLIIAIQSYSAVQFMPVTVANMGVREFYYSLFSKIVTPELTTITSEALLSISLLIVIFNIILPAIPGLIFLLLYHFTDFRQK